MARKQPKPIQQLTAAQFERMFPDEDACCAYLVGRRWPEGVVARAVVRSILTSCQTGPGIGSAISAPRKPVIASRISPGTIFENTNKPLRDWFRVVHLMLTSKKGMSALQIMRFMGFGTYKTAWLMCHKVRTALVEDVEQLGGIVEVDETFVGGKAQATGIWDKRGGGRAGGDMVPARPHRWRG